MQEKPNPARLQAPLFQSNNCLAAHLRTGFLSGIGIHSFTLLPVAQGWSDHPKAYPPAPDCQPNTLPDGNGGSQKHGRVAHPFALNLLSWRVGPPFGAYPLRCPTLCGFQRVGTTNVAKRFTFCSRASLLKTIEGSGVIPTVPKTWEGGGASLTCGGACENKISEMKTKQKGGPGRRNHRTERAYNGSHFPIPFLTARS